MSATSGLRAPGFRELIELLPHAPGDVNAGHVVDGEDAHRHAEVGQRTIDLLGRRAVLDQELRLVHVREHHAVTDEARRVARDHADFAEPLRNRERCREQWPATWPIRGRSPAGA